MTNTNTTFLLLAAIFAASCAGTQTPPDMDAVLDDGRFLEFVDGEVWRCADHEAGCAVASRIESLDGGSLREPVFWYGGRFQFMEICPEWGCLAVQFGPDGEVAQAWPLRPDLLEQAADAAAAEYAHRSTPGFSFARDAEPQGILRYPNGDLLVVFFNQNGNVPTDAGGAVRVDRRGYPVWFRRDLSHHWPHMENDGSVLVLARSFGDNPILVPLNDGGGQHVELRCEGRRPWLESVNVIDGDGRLLDSIDLTGAMLDSPFAPVLFEPYNRRRRPPRPCDLLHPNFIHRVGGDVRDVRDVSSGDLVVSMAGVSAFAILDAGSGRVKRVVRGSFRRQHAVHHWQDSRFLLFDNQGSDGVNGPARLLMVDLADGRETTIFPNAGTPEALRGLRSTFMGKISISPDRRRALVVFRSGVAVEVRLSDGAALRVFRSLHDVSGLEQFPEERATRPAVFRMTGLDYVQAP